MQNLKFRDDKSFSILQFTDLHWCNGEEKDLQTNRLMESILEKEKPDLVVFTGDVVFSANCTDPVYSFHRALEPVNKAQIPWAAVFGNHDTEEGVTKGELLAAQQEYPLCLTKKGDVSGIGNYSFKILDSAEKNTEWVLYFLDSGMINSNETVGGYDYIKRDQINWYVQQSTSNKERNHDHNELMFFHIPIPEYHEVWYTKECWGSKNEEICSPNVNSGLFSAMLETGRVRGTFVGHDHVNDFCGELYGIQLCYGRATGYNTYGKEGFPHGARMIHLREGENHFETQIRLDDGTTIGY